MSEHLYIEVLHIEPFTSVMRWVDLESTCSRSYAKHDTTNAKYTGLMTPTTKKKMMKAMDRLIAISNFQKFYYHKNGELVSGTMKLAFVTLTLPASQLTTPDREITKRVSRMMENFSKQYKGFKYVWRAERQENGNIHYHVIINRYLAAIKLRDYWNNMMDELGFIEAFEAKFKHRNPNSTDIHAVRKVKNMRAYACKYLTKVNSKPINGKCWDCSKSLKIKSNVKYELDSEEGSQMHRNLFNYKTVASVYASITFVEADYVISMGYDHWKNDWEKMLDIWRGYSLTPPE